MEGNLFPSDFSFSVRRAVSYKKSVAQTADRVLQVSDGQLADWGEVPGMKSYLSFIPISAKVHRRQNRMTLLFIIYPKMMAANFTPGIDNPHWTIYNSNYT